MHRRIGILGGISYESTREYYDLIHKKYYDRRHDHDFPEVVVFSLNFKRFTDYENSDTKAYIAYILEGLRGLEASGVDCIIMAANSPHSVYSHLVTQTAVPLYSISEATVQKAKALKLKDLLLLGIKHTMDSNFYPEAAAQESIRIVVSTVQEKKLLMISSFRNYVSEDSPSRQKIPCWRLSATIRWMGLFWAVPNCRKSSKRRISMCPY